MDKYFDDTIRSGCFRFCLSRRRIAVVIQKHISAITVDIDQFQSGVSTDHVAITQMNSTDERVTVMACLHPPLVNHVVVDQSGNVHLTFSINLKPQTLLIISKNARKVAKSLTFTKSQHSDTLRIPIRECHITYQH